MGLKKVKAILIDNKNSNGEHILKATYCQCKKITRPMEIKNPETEPSPFDQNVVQWGKDGLFNKCYWPI